MILHGADVGGVAQGYQIANSLRFRASASAYLSKTYGSGSANTKHAASFWFTRGGIPAAYKVLYSSFTDASNHTYIYITSTGQIGIYQKQGGTNNLGLASTLLVRDPSAWYHLFYLQDTTLATASARFRFWLNGIEITAWSTTTNTTTQNVATQFGSTTGTHYIGSENASSSHFDGYFAEFSACFQPTTLPAYSSFGEFNSDGVWVPKKYSGTYGNNGFYLPFNDATSLTTLGYDRSGNSNNWTCNNISLTAGVTYDHMVDTPTSGYAVLNPLDLNGTYTNSFGYGNLQVTQNLLAPLGVRGTSVLGAPTYWEAKYTNAAGTGYTYLGLCAASVTRTSLNPTGLASVVASQYIWRDDAYKANNGSSTAYGSALTSGDTVCFFHDPVNAAVWVGKVTGGVATWFDSGDPENNVSPMYSGIADAANQMPYFGFMGQNANPQWDVTFGQRPFLATSGIPTRAKTLCTANLPAVSITNPQQHHNVYTVTKSGNTNFTLDWDASVYDTYFEIKRRDSTGDWYNVDGLRGYDKILKSNSTAAETTDANVIGVSGTTCTLKSTLTDGTYVISAWKAGLTASRQTNTDGSITSTVSRNVTSGFAIVLSIGNATAGATTGHGLGQAPASIIRKSRTSGTGHWYVYHATEGNTKAGILQLTNAFFAGSVWNSTSPTSTVFSVGSGVDENKSGDNFLTYVHAEIPGYSKFGSYTGNGSADGPFVWCGFKQRRVLFKVAAGTTGHWEVFDTERSGYNVADDVLWPSSSGAEASGASYYFDIIAGGFKLRTTDTSMNASAATYIYSAYADEPFGGSNVSPATAR